MLLYIQAEKDTFITNKIISKKRRLNSNTGFSSTLDLFKLFNESYEPGNNGNVYEISRILIKFDYSPIVRLFQNGVLNINSNKFKVKLFLHDVYAGQTTPSNFILRIVPLAKNWDEGTGFDNVAFTDFGSANFLTASINPTQLLWTLPGASQWGFLGAPNVDFYASGSFGPGPITDITVNQVFNSGRENLFVDVTSLVSASIANIIPNYGFMISFSEAQEQNERSYFIKRFASRHFGDFNKRPKLIVCYDESIKSDIGKAEFDTTQKFIFFNFVNNSLSNVISGSTTLIGPNCMRLHLSASHQFYHQTTAYSPTHRMTITYWTRSLDSFNASFLVSQADNDGIPLQGIYSASVLLDTTTSSLFSFLSGALEHEFEYYVTSLDNTVVFFSGSTTFKKPNLDAVFFGDRNLICNIPNLKRSYLKHEEPFLRIVLQDYNVDLGVSRYFGYAKSIIPQEAYWRVIDANSKFVVIDYEECTRCWIDEEGPFFKFYMSSLEKGFYEFEIKVVLYNQEFYFENHGFIFKVNDY